MAMARHTGWWCGVVLVAGLAVTSAGQEIPKKTPEGDKILKELVRACVDEGGLKQVGEGEKATVQIDREKIRATLARRKGQLTPDLRDALVARSFQVVSDPSEEGVRPAVLFLLRAVAEETKDDCALGFASFLTGFEKEERFQLAEAAASYEQAAKYFSAAPDPAWQASSLNKLGSVLQAQGEYGKALTYFEQALE